MAGGGGVPARPPPHGTYIHGGDRQQYETFLLDTVLPPGTPPDTVLGVVDADTLPITFPTKESFFDHHGKPIVVGRVETFPPNSTGLWARAAGTTLFFLGKPQPARGMANFPFLVRAHHLSALRAHVEALHGAPFAATFKRLREQVYYSQFNIILTYLWHWHRDEYDFKLWVVTDPFVHDFSNPLAMVDPRPPLQPGYSGLRTPTGGWDFSVGGFRAAFAATPGADAGVLDAITPLNGASRVHTMLHWKHERYQHSLAVHLAAGLCYATAAMPSPPALCGPGGAGGRAMGAVAWDGSTPPLSVDFFHWEYTGWVLGQGREPQAAQAAHAAAVAAGVDAGELDVGRAVASVLRAVAEEEARGPVVLTPPWPVERWRAEAKARGE